MNPTHCEGDSRKEEANGKAHGPGEAAQEVGQDRHTARLVVKLVT